MVIQVRVTNEMNTETHVCVICMIGHQCCSVHKCYFNPSDTDYLRKLSLHWDKYVAYFNHSNAKDAKSFENHVNSVMLVFIG